MATLCESYFDRQDVAFLLESVRLLHRELQRFHTLFRQGLNTNVDKNLRQVGRLRQEWRVAALQGVGSCLAADGAVTRRVPGQKLLSLLTSLHPLHLSLRSSNFPIIEKEHLYVRVVRRKNSAIRTGCLSLRACKRLFERRHVVEI
jgi:hypothetical protein